MGPLPNPDLHIEATRDRKEIKRGYNGSDKRNDYSEYEKLVKDVKEIQPFTQKQASGLGRFDYVRKQIRVSILEAGGKLNYETRGDPNYKTAFSDPGRS